MGNAFSCLFPWKKDSSSDSGSRNKELATKNDDDTDPEVKRKAFDEGVWEIEDLENEDYGASNSNQTSSNDDDPLRSHDSDTDNAAGASVSTELSHHGSIDSGYAEVSSSSQEQIKTDDRQLTQSRDGISREYSRHVKESDCIPISLRQANEDYSKRMNKQRQMTRALVKLKKSPSSVRELQNVTESNVEINTDKSKGDMSQNTEDILNFEKESVTKESLDMLKDAFFTEFAIAESDKYASPVPSIKSTASNIAITECDNENAVNKGNLMHSKDALRLKDAFQHELITEDEEDAFIASDSNASNRVLFSKLNDYESTNDDVGIDLSDRPHDQSIYDDLFNSYGSAKQIDITDDDDDDDVPNSLVHDINRYRKPCKSKIKQIIREHKIHELITIVEENEEEDNDDIHEFCKLIVEKCVDKIVVNKDVERLATHIESDSKSCNTVLFSELNDNEFSECLAMFKRGASRHHNINTDIEGNTDDIRIDFSEISHDESMHDDQYDDEEVTNSLERNIYRYRKHRKNKLKKIIKKHKRHELMTIFEENEEDDKDEIQDFCKHIIEKCVDNVMVYKDVEIISHVIPERNTDEKAYEANTVTTFTQDLVDGNNGEDVADDKSIGVIHFETQGVGYNTFQNIKADDTVAGQYKQLQMDASLGINDKTEPGFTNTCDQKPIRSCTGKQQEEHPDLMDSQVTNKVKNEDLCGEDRETHCIGINHREFRDDVASHVAKEKCKILKTDIKKPQNELSLSSNHNVRINESLQKSILDSLNHTTDSYQQPRTSKQPMASNHVKSKQPLSKTDYEETEEYTSKGSRSKPTKIGKTDTNTQFNEKSRRKRIKDKTDVKVQTNISKPASGKLEVTSGQKRPSRIIAKSKELQPACMKKAMAKCDRDTKLLTKSATKDNKNVREISRVRIKQDASKETSNASKRKLDTSLPTKSQRNKTKTGTGRENTLRNKEPRGSPKELVAVEQRQPKPDVPKEDENYELVKQRGPDRGIVWPQTMEELYSDKDRAYYVEQFTRTELFRQRLKRKQDDNNAWSRALTQFQIWVIDHVGTDDMETILHPKVKRRLNKVKAMVTCWTGQPPSRYHRDEKHV